MSDCGGLRQLLGGYVLDALEPDEKAAVRRHLKSCQRCRAEYDELTEVKSLLDLLKAPAAALELSLPSVQEGVITASARPTAPRRRRFKSVRSRLGLTGCGVGLTVAIVVLALMGVFSPSRVPPVYGEVGFRGAAHVEGEAYLHRVDAGTEVELEVSGLPNDRSLVYELWCVSDDGRSISAGTFRVDARGGAHVSLTSAAQAGEYGRMVITRRTDGRRGRTVVSGTITS